MWHFLWENLQQKPCTKQHLHVCAHPHFLMHTHTHAHTLSCTHSLMHAYTHTLSRMHTRTHTLSLTHRVKLNTRRDLLSVITQQASQGMFYPNSSTLNTQIILPQGSSLHHQQENQMPPVQVNNTNNVIIHCDVVESSIDCTMKGTVKGWEKTHKENVLTQRRWDV